MPWRVVARPSAISSPAAPREMGFYDTPGAAKGVAVEVRRVVLQPDGQPGVLRADVVPQEVVGTAHVGDPLDLIMHEGYLYGLTEAPAKDEGPAVVQLLRFRPAVLKAIERQQRRLQSRSTLSSR